MPPPTTDLSSKLAASAKKSVFERQKAEAEAKKAREKAETAAVLESFVKSFDDENDSPQLPSKRSGAGFGPTTGVGFGSGPGKRHFTSSGLKSGPGSLGPSPSAPKSGPGSLGPTPAFGKKRPYDDYGVGRDRARDRDDDHKGMFSYGDNRDRDHSRETSAFAREEDESRDAEELKAAAKPTLHLSSLPPGTSPSTIKGLFTPSPLTIENVRILPSNSAQPSERKSISAIVTLAAETPATDIDTMVSHLQNKYLGFGFNLSISRHLSSAALTGSNSLSNNVPGMGLNNLPFGARPIAQHTSLSRAPPPGQGPGRFAPPTSYTSSTPYGPRSTAAPTQVTVQAPSDLKQLKLIHKTVEALLTYGPEFEALLMSRPQIQRDEQWAWLWNSRSIGGVYYRWRLWDILTNAEARIRRQPVGGYPSQPRGDVMFEGQSIWVPPENNLKFEYTTRLEDLISDDDYNSSDEEEMDDGGGLARRYQDHQKISGLSTDNNADNDGIGYLNPLGKTKLVHLLSRLPDSNSKLRKGDVARITGFAIEHAGAGADEVAALITRNVIKPFCFNVKKPKESGNDSSDEDDQQRFEQNSKPNQDEGTAELSQQQEKDTTATSLVGLYLISDILSCSASSGVRHAWRYRSLFETQLRQQNVFAILGRAERTYNWGKLKADKWHRSVQSVLSLWEGWCVFPSAAHDAFVDQFLHPPLTEAEKVQQEKKEAEAKALRDEMAREKGAGHPGSSVSRWRSVDEDEAAAQSASFRPGGDVAMGDTASVGRDLDGDPMPLDDEDDEDGITDADIDGVPMLDSSDEEDVAAEMDIERKDGPASVQASLPVPPPPPQPAEPEPPQSKDQSTAFSASTSNTTPSSQQPSAPQMSSRGRARPKAADFDDVDMFG